MQRSYAAGLTIRGDSYVDLQTHTVLSDGDWTAEALIDHLVREGFAAAAITDHDRVDTMAAVQDVARERDFPLLVAAEMTTRWRNSIVDILCFGFEHDPTPLNALCEAIRQRQSDTTRTVYANLVKGGYVREDAGELAAMLEATTSRQPYLLFDVFAAQNPTVEDSFGVMKAAGYQLCTHETGAVVAAAQASGGVALIAHPGRTDGYATFDEALLDAFRAEIPIDGIEVYYPKHTPEQSRLYEAYAKRHGWLMSAGSDSHSGEKPPIPYRAEVCRTLLERLEIRVI